MSELVLYQNKELTHPVTPNLVVEDIKESNMKQDYKMVIIASKCFPKINMLKGEKFPEGTIVNEVDLSGKEIRQFQIRQHINKAILHSGFGASLTTEDLNELILSVIMDVLTDFSHLTTQEVGIAFKKGCREEYGEYMGVSTRIFYKWLKSYCQETRHDSFQEFKKIDVPKVVLPSKEEIEKRHQEWLEGIFIAYDEYVKTGELKFYDINNMFYEYLKDLGIITINKQMKKSILIEAEKILRIQNDPLQEPNQFKRVGLLAFIDKLNKKDESLNDKILTQAKHIHLKRFLSDLRTKKKCLKTIVTEKTQQN